MVRTKLEKSETHGIGLFAAEFIKKGTVTWRFMPGLDLIVPEDILLQISESARAQFLNYCYVDKNTKHFILCFDDERFINHSENPNIGQRKVGNEIEGVEVALCDIEEGEELKCDYNVYDLDAFRKLNNLDVYSYINDPRYSFAGKPQSKFIETLIKFGYKKKKNSKKTTY